MCSLQLSFQNRLGQRIRILVVLSRHFPEIDLDTPFW